MQLKFPRKLHYHRYQYRYYSGETGTKAPSLPNQEVPETGMPSLPTLPTFDNWLLHWLIVLFELILKFIQLCCMCFVFWNIKLDLLEMNKYVFTCLKSISIQSADCCILNSGLEDPSLQFNFTMPILYLVYSQTKPFMPWFGDGVESDWVKCA